VSGPLIREILFFSPQMRSQVGYGSILPWIVVPFSVFILVLAARERLDSGVFPTCFTPFPLLGFDSYSNDCQALVELFRQRLSPVSRTNVLPNPSLPCGPNSHLSGRSVPPKVLVHKPDFPHRTNIVFFIYYVPLPLNTPRPSGDSPPPRTRRLRRLWHSKLASIV